MNSLTKILCIGAMLATAACDSQRVISTGDGGVDSRPVGPSNTANVPPSTTTTGCQRPAGTCLTDGDCPGEATCIRPAKTSYEDPGCQVDPCCDAGDGARKRPMPDAGVDYNPPAPGSEDEPGLVPPCVDCLGRCSVSKCVTSDECGAGYYCDLGPACGQPGTCQPRPASCGGSDEARQPGPDPDGEGDGDWAPEYPGDGVCGCDGIYYDTECGAIDAGTSVEHLGPCSSTQPPPTDLECQGVACAVRNNCCECYAYDLYPSADPMPKPGPCPDNCEVYQCEALFGLTTPKAYCVAGRCLLTDATDACKTDSDCYMVDDCCACRALPNTVKQVPCPADCFVSQCTALGIGGQVTPRCVAGSCQLVRF